MARQEQRIDQAAVAVARDELAAGQYRKFLERYRTELQSIAPPHVATDAFLGLAAAYIRRSEKLSEAFQANPGSLVLALRQCATLGHVPDPRVYALVPFRDNKTGAGWQITGIETYHGIIDRMFRAGGVRSVHVEVGRVNDAVLRFNRTRDVLPQHEYDEFADKIERGPLKAVYAWAVMLDGSNSYVAWLPRPEVMRHRASAKTADFWGPDDPDKEGPNAESMWKKTALRVLETFVPTSAAYRWEVIRSQAAAEQRPLVVPATTPGPAGGYEPPILDVETVPDGPTTEWPATATIPNGDAQ